MPAIANRLNNLPEYVFARIARQVRELQSNGADVIRMDMGSPDLPPADFVMDALDKSARVSSHHSYSGYRGTAGFREAVARYYQKRFEVDLDPETEVMPLIGSKEGIVNLTLAYIDKGDIALVPAIGYPTYSMGIRLAGGEISFVDMPGEKDFLLDVNSVAPDIADKAKLLWANYPNNPTGAIATLEFYEELIAFCKKHDILLASDNPYCDVTYDGYRAPSALQVNGAKEVAVEFMSMSKTFNMAGWRLGAAVGNKEALQNLLKVKSNIDSGHFTPAYDAGVSAMDNINDEWLAERNAIYQKRRDVILDNLDAAGLEAKTPQASLYIWSKVKATSSLSAAEYVKQAREHAHVSLAPGAAYGPGGDDYIRMSVTTTDERLQEGMERLIKWYESIQN